MAVESAADRAAFVDPAEFGTAAVFTPAGGPGVAVNGLFDDQFAGPRLAGLAIEAREITFLARSADLPGAQQGDSLTIGATTYTVRSVRPDGAGMTTLVLKV